MHLHQLVVLLVTLWSVNGHLQLEQVRYIRVAQGDTVPGEADPEVKVRSRINCAHR